MPTDPDTQPQLHLKKKPRQRPKFRWGMEFMINVFFVVAIDQRTFIFNDETRGGFKGVCSTLFGAQYIFGEVLTAN